MLAPWKESYDKSRQHVRKHTHHFADKGPYSQSYGFSSSCVQMWDHKEGWVLKKWCFWIVVLEKTRESSPFAKRSNRSILKEISPEYSLEGLILQLKLQYFGHPMWRADFDERRFDERRKRRFWCRERLKAKREEGGRGWNR